MGDQVQSADGISADFSKSKALSFSGLLPGVEQAQAEVGPGEGDPEAQFPGLADLAGRLCETS